MYVNLLMRRVFLYVCSVLLCKDGGDAAHKEKGRKQKGLREKLGYGKWYVGTSMHGDWQML